jgi:hypothetical protein
MPLPSGIEEFRKKFAEYYKTNPDVAPGFEADVYESLIQRFCEMTDVSVKSNNVRSRMLHKTMGRLLLGLLFLLITFSAYMALSCNQTP